MGDTLPVLGNTTMDVYLNGEAFWCNIPAAVWDYRLGGYQVLKSGCRTGSAKFWTETCESRKFGTSLTCAADWGAAAGDIRRIQEEIAMTKGFKTM